MTLSQAPPREVLAAWNLQRARLRRLPTGLINRTFLAQDGPVTLVLQRLGPIFTREVNLDIEAVTGILAAAGMQTPRLVPTLGGHRDILDGEGGVWRALTYMPGLTVERVDSPARALSAGRLLGRFHHALWGCTYSFRHRRMGVHDTAAHLQRLDAALEQRRDHRCYGEVEPVGRRILAAAGRLPLPSGLPERVVHGDPKITNLLFDHRGEALCLVDLDTLARMPLCLELGDALRSWCSTGNEEVEAELDLDLVRAALTGWAAAAGHLPTPEELGSIPPAAGLIALELAARFCADALEERYFGWDRRRFDSAAQHNLLRARSQLALGLSATSKADAIAAMMETLPG